MTKVLMAIPTYNPGANTKNFGVWKANVEGLIAQNKPDLQVDVVVCDNMSTQVDRDKLLELKKTTPGLTLIFTDTRYSHHICINHVFRLFRDRGYDWMGNCCSDIISTDPDTISTLLEDAKFDPDCVTISPQISNDMNDKFPEHIGLDVNMPPTMFKVPQYIGGHFYLHDKRFLEAWDYGKPDVLWGHRHEGFVSFCAAAIRKREYVSHRVMCNHDNQTMEREKSFLFYDRPYDTWGSKEDFIKMIESGQSIGIGWEECYYYNRGIEKVTNQPPPESRAHNPDAYDENKYPKTDELYHFLKKNLFLNKEQLDYDKLNAKIYE